MTWNVSNITDTGTEILGTYFSETVQCVTLKTPHRFMFLCSRLKIYSVDGFIWYKWGILALIKNFTLLLDWLWKVVKQRFKIFIGHSFSKHKKKWFLFAFTLWCTRFEWLNYSTYLTVWSNVSEISLVAVNKISQGIAWVLLCWVLGVAVAVLLLWQLTHDRERVRGVALTHTSSNNLYFQDLIISTVLNNILILTIRISKESLLLYNMTYDHWLQEVWSRKI